MSAEGQNVIDMGGSLEQVGDQIREGVAKYNEKGEITFCFDSNGFVNLMRALLAEKDALDRMKLALGGGSGGFPIEIKSGTPSARIGVIPSESSAGAVSFSVANFSADMQGSLVVAKRFSLLFVADKYRPRFMDLRDVETEPKEVKIPIDLPPPLGGGLAKVLMTVAGFENVMSVMRDGVSGLFKANGASMSPGGLEVWVKATEKMPDLDRRVLVLVKKEKSDFPETSYYSVLKKLAEPNI